MTIDIPKLFLIGLEKVHIDPLPNDASQAEFTIVSPE